MIITYKKYVGDFGGEGLRYYSSTINLAVVRRGCGQNLGLIMQKSQDDVYTQSDSVRREIA